MEFSWTHTVAANKRKTDLGLVHDLHRFLLFCLHAVGACVGKPPCASETDALLH